MKKPAVGVIVPKTRLRSKSFPMSQAALDEALRMRHTPLMDAWNQYQMLLTMYRLAEEQERKNGNVR